jgi:Tol biopolymer transport system component/DNA-binding winged helix-turn-helix (wHTH) protein
VAEAVNFPRLIRFGIFEVDLQSGELRKAGVKLKLTGQPFQVLAILLEHPGEIVAREELQKRLWPDTFVDVDHNLNTAINRIREVLGDSAENPRFVETLPRRGYRFIAPLDNAENGVKPATIMSADTAAPRRWRILGAAVLFGALALLASAGFLAYKGRHAPASPKQRTLTRITFDDGLQMGATWSPDGRYVAYSSDHGGKFDVWVQQVSGGDPVQVTQRLGHNWQPDWSPDGQYIAYRSEEGDGGLYIIPALGGAGLERRISSFGYFPRWSPDSSQILFQTHFAPLDTANKFYLAHLDGSVPKQVLAEFLAHHKLWPAAAVWHPDGKRVSVWAEDEAPSPSIRTVASVWTVPISGEPAIKMEIAPAIKNELAEVANANVASENLGDFSFAWSPSGKALYFECGYREAINVWRLTIEPETFRATAIERLTTGSGPDVGLAVSRDGRRLAFTAKSQQIRNWLFPFDATTGRITDKGQAITAAGRTAFGPNLSRDGKRVGFSVNRAGASDLWEKSLGDGREVPIIADEHSRVGPLWSPDGMQLVYTRQKSSEATPYQMMIWSSQTHSEEPLTTLSEIQRFPYDWSPDGASLLVVSQVATDTKCEVWLVPVAAAPHAETAARKIISDPKHDLYQPHFSPNGRWIVFDAVASSPTIAEPTLYVVPAAGGAWTRITDGKHWDDKPRWSPDGRTIYFVSGRGGFFNVWGIRFDPAEGKPVGEPFRVSAFEGPGLMIPKWIPPVELSLNQDKLVLNMAEVSGGIWVLDNVDR